MYTFTAQTIMDYLQSNPDLSDFAKIVEISKISPRSDSPVSALLNLYGEHTCFAPTNEAVKLYLDSVCGTGQYDVATLPQEIADEIVHNCVIEEKGLYTTKFFEGALAERTLNDRHLIIELGDFGDGVTIRVNRRARVIDADIKVYNGYVHIVDKVVPMVPNTLPALINEQSNLRIFARLLQATTWADSMLQYRDNEYDEEYKVICAEKINFTSYPEYRLTGRIAFTETDSVFHEDWQVPLPIINPEDQSIENWEEILSVIKRKCQEAYPDATSEDLPSQDNAVNQFVSYHILPFMVPLSDLFNEKYSWGLNKGYQINHWDFTRPMGKPNRILKIIKTGADGIYHLNRHCSYDNGFNGTYKETSCDYEGITISPNNGSYLDNYAPNGYFYPIDHVLLYTDYVRNVVLNDRLRYTVNMMVPELYSNGLYRGGYNTKGNLAKDYIKSLQWEKGDSYHLMYDYYAQSQIYVQEGEHPTMTFPLLPVPYAGTWEIRLWNGNAVSPNQLVKVMIGTSPREYDMKFVDFFYTAPHMLTIGNIHTLDHVNLVRDSDMGYDSVQCILYDKCLRNLGWMKGPKITYCSTDTRDTLYVKRSARDDYTLADMRIILMKTHLEPNKTYYLRIQEMIPELELPSGGYTDRINYVCVELVPKSVYDNPYRAEDVW